MVNNYSWLLSTRLVSLNNPTHHPNIPSGVVGGGAYIPVIEEILGGAVEATEQGEFVVC